MSDTSAQTTWEAWKPYAGSNPDRYEPVFKVGFSRGYVQALLDAADELDYERNLYMEEILRIADGLKLTGSFTVQSARQYMETSRTEPAEWLRARAADAGGSDE